MAKAIADEWKIVFEEKPSDTEEAEDILGEYANITSWDWSVSPSPTSEGAQRYLGKLGDHQPGTDGKIASALEIWTSWC